MTDTDKDLKLDSTALLLACKKNLELVATLLINKCDGCCPEFVDSEGHTALMYACKNKMKNVAKAILDTYKEKSNFAHADKNSNTALSYACKNEDFDNIVTKIYELYMIYLADIKKQNLICKNDLDILAKLIEQKKEHIDYIRSLTILAHSYGNIKNYEKMEEYYLLAVNKGIEYKELVDTYKDACEKLYDKIKNCNIYYPDDTYKVYRKYNLGYSYNKYNRYNSYISDYDPYSL
jgi:ankyrin repeat protein